jgi:hypothetical protein
MKQQPAALWDDPFIEARWGKKPGFMSDLRARGQGPRFLRLSARTIRYRPEDVTRYEDQQEFGNTAESMETDFTAPAADSQPIGGENSPRKRRFSAETGLPAKV